MDEKLCTQDGTKKLSLIDLGRIPIVQSKGNHISKHKAKKVHHPSERSVKKPLKGIGTQFR